MKNELRLSLMLSSAFLLAACEVGPDYKRPAVEITEAYKEAGDWKPAQPHDTFDRGTWWTIYNDTTLNDLEKQIDISNQNLKASEAAYEQALAVVEETRSELFPTIGIGGSALASGSLGSKNSAAGKSTSVITYAVGPTASWDIDVWGRIRRAIEANQANAEASAADLAAARLSAQAVLATDYFDLRVQDELKRLLDNTVTDDTKILKITENQYKVGVAAKADVLSAQTQLESVQSQDVNTGVRRAQLEHALAVLVGKPPAEFTLPPVMLVNRVPDLPGETPSALLERRPDIAAAERAMIAANAEIGVAEAAYYPDISLSASLGYTATGLGKLFQASNSLWTVGPAISETIFDAGAREAEVEQNEAAYAQTVALYRQTVLTGFQQVEDELAAQRILAQQAEIQDKTVTDARLAEKLTLNQYQQGIVPYNNVLTAQITTLTNEQAALTVEDGRLDASVSLIQALGGGWDTSQLADPLVYRKPPEPPAQDAVSSPAPDKSAPAPVPAAATPEQPVAQPGAPAAPPEAPPTVSAAAPAADTNTPPATTTSEQPVTQPDAQSSVSPAPQTPGDATLDDLPPPVIIQGEPPVIIQGDMTKSAQ